MFILIYIFGFYDWQSKCKFVYFFANGTFQNNFGELLSKEIIEYFTNLPNNLRNKV